MVSQHTAQLRRSETQCLLHQSDAAVNDGLVQFEVGNAIAQEATGGFVLLENGHSIALPVEHVGCCQTGRTGTDHSYPLAIPDGHSRLDISLAKSSLDNGSLVLAVGRRFMVEAVEHTGLFAKCRTNAACELGKGIGACQQSVGLFPLAFIQGVVPFGCLVPKRTSPVAERHAAVHAAACLKLTLTRIERLLHLAEIVNSIVNRAISRLLAVYV